VFGATVCAGAAGGHARDLCRSRLCCQRTSGRGLAAHPKGKGHKKQTHAEARNPECEHAENT
jgi:hypothetical protein